LGGLMVGDERRPLQVELPSGQVVWVRVSPDESVGPGAGPATDAGKPENGLAQDTGGFHRRTKPKDSDAAGKETRRLVGFAEAVSGVAESVRASLTKARPDTVEVEFGLDIDMATGHVVSLITEAHAAASMKVKLGWDLGARAEAARAGLVLGGDWDDDAAGEEPGDAQDDGSSGPAAVEAQIGPETLDALAGTEGGDDD